MSNENISMENILSSAKLQMALSEWKNIKEKAKEFCTLEEEQQKEQYKLYFDIESLEKSASDTFDILVKYSDQKVVPKEVVMLYRVLVEISSLEYLKSWDDGHLQFWTSLSDGLGNLVTERVKYEEDDRGFTFYMDDRQHAVEPGVYLYNLDTYNYHFIGAQLPW